MLTTEYIEKQRRCWRLRLLTVINSRKFLRIIILTSLQNPLWVWVKKKINSAKEKHSNKEKWSIMKGKKLTT